MTQLHLNYLYNIQYFIYWYQSTLNNSQISVSPIDLEQKKIFLLIQIYLFAFARPSAYYIGSWDTTLRHFCTFYRKLFLLIDKNNVKKAIKINWVLSSIVFWILIIFIILFSNRQYWVHNSSYIYYTPHRSLQNDLRRVPNT